LTEVGSLLDTTGKAFDALVTYRRAESVLSDIAVSDPTARPALSVCRTRLGMLLFFADDYTGALASLKLARADQEAAAAVPGAPVEIRHDLAVTLNDTGFVLWGMGRPTEAEPEIRGALAIYQQLADENQAVPEFRRGLGASHFYLGNVLGETGKPLEAEKELGLALALQEKATKDNAAVTKNRKTLVVTRNYLGKVLTENGKFKAAETDYRTAIAILKTLMEENIGVPDFRSLEGSLRQGLGSLLLRMDKPQDAELECRLAETICQELENQNPTKRINRLRHAMALNALGDVVRLSGRAAEAKGIYERTIALAEPQLQENPNNTYLGLQLVCSIRCRGLTLRELGDSAGAAADSKRALRLCDSLPPLISCVFETACCHAALAALSGRPNSGVSAAEGKIAADSAMKWLNRAVAMGYQNANELRIESAFDPLRGRDDFKKLLAEVEQKSPAEAKQKP
jgi:tetratricopeptide (TPR) repeat protein